jgi:hypothetical protein
MNYEGLVYNVEEEFVFESAISDIGRIMGTDYRCSNLG